MSVARRVALAAVLIAAGNIASRALGLLREAVIAGLFARSAELAAFRAAATIPTTLYDLLISGAISAALVPVLSAYAEDDPQTFWRVASTVINLVLLLGALLVGLLIWQAPLVVTVLAGGFDPTTRAQTTAMVQLLLPATLLMALAGLITALLYAQQRFLLPAFTTSAYNLGIILGALLLTPLLGPLSLVAGVLAGALLQVLLQLPGLRGGAEVAGTGYRPLLDLAHPGVQRILKLYAPVALGIGFSTIGVVLDRNLASGLGTATIPTMSYATNLVQFPLGLVAAAVASAVLPTLSRQAHNNDQAAFRTTLAMGLKVVLLLVLPATAGLAALATPITALLFERGRFAAEDTAQTALALLLYLPGLPAAAIDQVLLFAFYARNRTLLPNLVQGAAIAIYTLTALGLLALTPLRIEALILGNAAQWIGHVLLLLLFARGLVQLAGQRLGEALLKCLVASLVMALAVWGVVGLLGTAAGPLLTVVVGGLVGLAVYTGMCLLLRVEALGLFVAALRRRWG